VKFYICPLFPQTVVLPLPRRHVLHLLVWHTRWPEWGRSGVPCCGPCGVPMCHLNDGTGRCGQSRGTIPIVDGAVQAIHLVAAKHIHLVLSFQVPVSMLSKRLTFVELAMPRLTSSLHLTLPSVPRL
jgi:hypothetical protein